MIDGAQAQAKEVTVKRDKPQKRVGLRPKESLMLPTKSWPVAEPSRQTITEYCTKVVVLPKSRSSIGRAGR